MSINKCFISGNLTRDPERKQTQSGSFVLSFGMAVNERVQNRQTQQWEDKPNFVDCVMFGKRAESLASILRKGMKVFVEGKLRYSSWDKGGNKRSKIEVVAEEVELPPRGQQNDSQGNYAQQPNSYTNQGQYGPQNGYQQPAGYDEYFGGGAY